MSKSLTDIKRESPEVVLADLKSDNTSASTEAGIKLLSKARSFGVSLSDYLKLSVDVSQADNPDKFARGNKLANGYEASLQELGLPVRDDFDNGITLQLAADTFQTYKGTRALFPEVVDDMVKWSYNQDQFERTEPMVAQTRTTSAVELITTVVSDTQADYRNPVRAIPERGRIPTHSISTGQQSVEYFKFGSGYSTTYEFGRRASLDILTPYANRTLREIELSKVAAATTVLISGDGVNGAAPVVTQTSFNSKVNTTPTNGVISYQHLLAWLVSRAQEGKPIDTVVGNWDAYLQWLFMFSVPTTANQMTDSEKLAKAGFQTGGVPLLTGTVNFVLSSTAPAGRLIGYSKGDTLEELLEAGSMIEESEKSIKTQETFYVRTETCGYKLIFDDTRSIYNFNG